MKICSILIRSGLLMCAGLQCLSSEINPELLQHRWPARWISHPAAHQREYGVYHFRKTFHLKSVPESFIIHCSADNRYRLFVNGTPVCAGPARGDPDHWRFETLNIASFLRKGKNVIASAVWFFGDLAPWAQMEVKTGFILQGDSETESMVNTDRSWKVMQNRAYSPTGRERAQPYQFMVVGPGDRVRGELYPWRWHETDYCDSLWLSPLSHGSGTPYGMHDPGMPWLLVPRTLPMMEETRTRFRRVAGVKGFSGEPSCIHGENDTIPRHTSVTLLLDQGYLTNAYPELTVSGGKQSEISLVYGEALFDSLGHKGHRDSVAGRHILGPYDAFHPDGGSLRRFRPLWFRTYRYLQMEIQTGPDPLVLHDFYGMFTAYPFRRAASFSSGDSSLTPVWKTGWRTARLCAGETYFDCPFYEQLQYAGDTRIQALISLYLTEDDRLVRNAIQQFSDSRIPEGLTASRYPSRIDQIIPPYSLFWIAMIHDYWMLRRDDAFVRSFLHGIQGVIAWYEAHIDSTGMLGPMPWWNFVDWPEAWAWSAEKGIGGVPAGAEDGNSAIISLQFSYVLNYAAELMEAFHQTCVAVHYRELNETIKASVYQLCWDEERQLLSDTPEKESYSQHANVMAVLTDLIPQHEQTVLLERIIGNPSLIPCTYYYRFYLHEALKKAGLGDRYLEMLAPWHAMIRLGLTTFAERPEPTRSDCHAWSAHPNYHFLSLVCGIEPAGPGFRFVRITPHLGYLEWVQAEMPHPQGKIALELKRQGKSLEGTVRLPEGVRGILEWRDERIRIVNETSFSIEIKDR